MAQEEKLRHIIHIQAEIAKHGLDLGRVLDYVVECTPSLLDADGAAIELAEGDDMVYRAASGMAKPHLGLRLKINESLSGQSYQSGEIYICDDAQTDPRVNAKASQSIGVRSMLIMPLEHAGNKVGIFKALSANPHAFNEQHVELVTLLSEVIAASMYFASSYSKDALFIRATQDSLTGLANRSVFMDRLRIELAACEKSNQKLAVVIFDIDNLKPVNDDFGHRAGDALLKGFAMRLKSASRYSDVVARIGGDEFALMLHPVDGAEQVDNAVARIQQRLSAMITFENHVFPLESSIGYAVFPEDGDAVDKLMHKADKAMYANKRLRKGEQEPVASSARASL